MAPVIRALRALEAELNDARPPPYDAYPHPINLNVGVIHGGDWPSTVAGECRARFRLALYPGESVEGLRERIEAVVASRRGHGRLPGGASAGGQSTTASPARATSCRGGAAGDGVVGDVRPAGGGRAGPDRDHRYHRRADVGLHGGIPSVCFGPYAEAAHGVDERVYLPSVVQTAQVLALFIRDWCGVTG